MNAESFIEQIGRAIERWNDVTAQSRPVGKLSTEIVSETYALLAATLKRVAPPGSSYVESASVALDRPGDPYSLTTLVGVLQAIRLLMGSMTNTRRSKSP